MSERGLARPTSTVSRDAPSASIRKSGVSTITRASAPRCISKAALSAAAIIVALIALNVSRSNARLKFSAITSPSREISTEPSRSFTASSPLRMERISVCFVDKAAPRDSFRILARPIFKLVGFPETATTATGFIPEHAAARRVAEDPFVAGMLKGGFSDLLGNDALVVEAFRDLLREEVKAKMRAALEANPELKQELKDAVQLYFEAKVHEYYATLKFAKASAKLGVTLLPDQLRNELGKDIGRFIERELSSLLEKSL